MPPQLSSPSKHGNRSQQNYIHRNTPVSHNIQPTNHQTAENIHLKQQVDWLKKHQEFVRNQQRAQRQHEKALRAKYNTPEFREYQVQMNTQFHLSELAMNARLKTLAQTGRTLDATGQIIPIHTSTTPHYSFHVETPTPETIAQQKHADRLRQHREDAINIKLFYQRVKSLPINPTIAPASIDPKIQAEAATFAQKQFQSQSYRVRMDQTIDTKLYLLEKSQIPLVKQQLSQKPKSIPPKQDRWYYQEKFRANGWNEAELKHVAKYYRDASDYQRGRGNTQLADKYLHMHDAAKVELITQKRLVSAADNKAKRAARVRHATERYQQRQLRKAAKYAMHSPSTFADDNDSIAARAVRKKTAKPHPKSKPKKTD